ncbi:hypothetical protein EDB92DRAFT_1952868 [Lactarius akahatsu]|uniref:Uncharacterized protein n=1 Tax=Lactarius akahatsu TaxID=416441 RepID=A0AAD4L8I9_9AGAM|nr:hypothetical protein EDB92DRAFT_1952868 [Lactarius akahatsu]
MLNVVDSGPVVPAALSPPPPPPPAPVQEVNLSQDSSPCECSISVRGNVKYFAFTPGSNEFSLACDDVRSVPARTACVRARLHIEGFGPVNDLEDTLCNPAASVTEAKGADTP